MTTFPPKSPVFQLNWDPVSCVTLNAAKDVLAERERQDKREDEPGLSLVAASALKALSKKTKHKTVSHLKSQEYKKSKIAKTVSELLPLLFANKWREKHLHAEFKNNIQVFDWKNLIASPSLATVSRQLFGGKNRTSGGKYEGYVQLYLEGQARLEYLYKKAGNILKNVSNDREKYHRPALSWMLAYESLHPPASNRDRNDSHGDHSPSRRYSDSEADSSEDSMDKEHKKSTHERRVDYLTTHVNKLTTFRQHCKTTLLSSLSSTSRSSNRLGDGGKLVNPPLTTARGLSKSSNVAPPDSKASSTQPVLTTNSEAIRFSCARGRTITNTNANWQSRRSEKEKKRSETKTMMNPHQEYDGQILWLPGVVTDANGIGYIKFRAPHGPTGFGSSMICLQADAVSSLRGSVFLSPHDPYQPQDGTMLLASTRAQLTCYSPVQLRLESGPTVLTAGDRVDLCTSLTHFHRRPPKTIALCVSLFSPDAPVELVLGADEEQQTETTMLSHSQLTIASSGNTRKRLYNIQSLANEANRRLSQWNNPSTQDNQLLPLSKPPSYSTASPRQLAAGTSGSRPGGIEKKSKRNQKKKKTTQAGATSSSKELGSESSGWTWANQFGGKSDRKFGETNQNEYLLTTAEVTVGLDKMRTLSSVVKKHVKQRRVRAQGQCQISLTSAITEEAAAGSDSSTQPWPRHTALRHDPQPTDVSVLRVALQAMDVSGGVNNPQVHQATLQQAIQLSPSHSRPQLQHNMTSLNNMFKNSNAEDPAGYKRDVVIRTRGRPVQRSLAGAVVLAHCNPSNLGSETDMESARSGLSKIREDSEALESLEGCEVLYFGEITSQLYLPETGQEAEEEGSYARSSAGSEYGAHGSGGGRDLSSVSAGAANRIQLEQEFVHLQTYVIVFPSVRAVLAYTLTHSFCSHHHPGSSSSGSRSDLDRAGSAIGPPEVSVTGPSISANDPFIMPLLFKALAAILRLLSERRITAGSEKSPPDVRLKVTRQLTAAVEAIREFEVGGPLVGGGIGMLREASVGDPTMTGLACLVLSQLHIHKHDLELPFTCTAFTQRMSKWLLKQRVSSKHSTSSVYNSRHQDQDEKNKPSYDDLSLAGARFVRKLPSWDTSFSHFSGTGFHKPLEHSPSGLRSRRGSTTTGEGSENEEDEDADVTIIGLSPNQDLWILYGLLNSKVALKLLTHDLHRMLVLSELPANLMTPGYRPHSILYTLYDLYT